MIEPSKAFTFTIHIIIYLAFRIWITIFVIVGLHASHSHDVWREGWVLFRVAPSGQILLQSVVRGHCDLDLWPSWLTDSCKLPKFWPELINYMIIYSLYYLILIKVPNYFDYLSNFLSLLVIFCIEMRKSYLLKSNLKIQKQIILAFKSLQKHR